jgi:two-component system phosphate regulon sensor histidine kinase PhoR
MRLPLFVRILIIIFIPFFLVLIASNILINPAVISINKSNQYLIFLLGFLISVLLAYLTSRKFTEALKTIENSLQKQEIAKISNRSIQKMPLEIENLYLKIRESDLQNSSAQASLIADKKMFDSILENMTDGILIADKNGMVSMINHSANQLFQIRYQDAINHSLAEVSRDYRITELFEKCLKTHNQETISFEIAPDKTFIQCIATPLDPEAPGNILFLIQDLTRIHQLEIIRRDFVSNVSHELRTPLTSLKLITETLVEGTVDDPVIVKNFIIKMSSEVDNLTQLVEELLELSKIESGRVQLEKKFMKPYDLINNACERMQLQAKRAGLELKNSCSLDLPSIFIDQTRLEQVLLNLIHNAIKFTPPGGKVEVSAYQEASSIIFYVKDNGKGIPPKDLERIFERFYKTDRSRSEKGTGLGLSISRHLVEAHQGKIWAESQVGLGSTFYFSIPLK